MSACETFEAAGVLGPVRPEYESPPPRWIVDGRFWERPEHPCGHKLIWKDCRTGNVLLRRDILKDLPEPFDPKFGSGGGEDVEFFMRMMGKGHRFVWCNEAAVHETVPNERCTRAYMLRRALLRGRNTANRRAGRGGLVARSLVAAPVYLAMLPFTLVLGQHVFMKYCIKLFDHAGRVLTLCGLNPVRER